MGARGRGDVGAAVTRDDLLRLSINTNVAAFLRVIRERESSQDDSAYSVINGGAHFDSFARHPYKGQRTPPGRAAGAYQYIASTWGDVEQQYGMPDFSPASQDAGAVARLIYRGALEDVLAGRFAAAVARCRHEWTSLPGASESSTSWTMDRALAVYRKWGGRTDDEVSALRREGRNQPMPAPAPGVPSNQPGGTMDPFSLAAVARIVGMIPSLLGVIGGDKAERNQKAAQIVVDTFTAAVPGAANAQDAVQKAEADPAVRAAAVAAVESSPAVMSFVEVGGGVAAARKANADYMAGVEDDEWWRMLLKVVANPAMLISAAGLYLVYRFVPALADQVVKLSPEVVASLITSIVVGTLGAIFGFWLGQTWQQKRRDDA